MFALELRMSTQANSYVAIDHLQIGELCYIKHYGEQQKYQHLVCGCYAFKLII